MALTQEQITNYLASKGLPLTPEGIRAGLAAYNKETGSNLGIGDVGSAYGMDRQQASTWMNGGKPLTFSGMFGDNVITARPTDGVFSLFSTPTEEQYKKFISQQIPAANQSEGSGIRGDILDIWGNVVHDDSRSLPEGATSKYDAVLSQIDPTLSYKTMTTMNPLSFGTQSWTYDPKTQTYTSPTGKQVSIADLGFSDPITATYALGQMASREGKNIDPWSAYPAKTYADWTPDQYRGALTNDLPKITEYESKDHGTLLDKLILAAPWIAGAALVGGGISGALAPYEAGAATLGGGEAAGGLLATQAPAPVADAAMTPVGAGGAAGGGGTYMGISGAGGAAGGAAGGGGTYMGLNTALTGAGLTPAQAATVADAVSKGAGTSAVTKMLTDMGVSATTADLITKVLPAVAGAVVAGSSSGGAKQTGTTTETSSRAPWEPIQPFLTDIANAARSNYQQSSSMTPEQMALLGRAKNIATGQMNDPNMAGLRSMSADVFTGKSDQFKPVQSITAQQVDPFGFQSAVAPQISVGGAFNRMGGVNPTQAYQSLLSGNVTNPYLQNIANDNFTMATRNMMENVMPGIGSGAMAAGQYGGSRQGIAQGLAMSRLNQDVTAANNNMFGNAYQQAQGNMLSAAGQLGNFGMGAETQNASNILNNNQFNSSLASGIAQNNANRTLTADTTNASNTLAGNNQRLGQMNDAVRWYNDSYNMQNTGIKNALDLANYGNTYQNDALKNYAGVVAPLGGMGGTGSSSTPYYTNPTNSLLGGALAGSQIFKNIFA